ncbi:hypothetical protein EOL73_04020 [Candidatus Saccharibacteria bacterium]|nr:hypothetical protein [Candidatus Saccharibacteria bacterium]
MKLINIEQNTEEWLQAREGKITGSRAKLFSSRKALKREDLEQLARKHGIEIQRRGVTGNLLKTLKSVAELSEEIPQGEIIKAQTQAELSTGVFELIAERLAKPVQFSDYGEEVRSWKDRGHALEEIALKELSDRVGLNFTKGKFYLSDEDDNIALSPDGIIENDPTIMAEIKCLSSPKMVENYYTGSAKDEYWPQIIHYFVVNEKLETLYFFVYSDLFVSDTINQQLKTITREELTEEIEFAKAKIKATLELVEAECEGFEF